MKGKMFKVSLFSLMAMLLAGIVSADVIVNGSFETGDYAGWQLAEGAPANYGTWGIAKDGQVIKKGDLVFDFCDQILNAQESSGLPRTYSPSDGMFMAFQLQKGGQEHRMFQDVKLPGSAKVLSWDMFFDNRGTAHAADQHLAVHIRDIDDQILETLFLTDSSTPLASPMASYIYDISSYAGQSIRIDVALKIHRNYFDAGFDNFRIGTETVAAPPGWSRSKGNKTGWTAVPPGLEKKGNLPSGFETGKKNGWNKE